LHENYPIVLHHTRHKTSFLRRSIIPTVIFILLYELVAAQLTVVQGTSMGMTPEQLVREHLVGKGVAISNVTLNDSPGLISKTHSGYFQAAGGAFEQLNMEGGIIMTTGRADYAIGPNNKPSMGFRSNSGSDPDLELLTGSNAFDACILEFDFIPQCDTMRFRYAFGSEEFYEFCGKNINDAFGFLLSGPGIDGEFSNNSRNIATMPGSSGFVTINNICPDSSVAWNNRSGSFLQYDAMTWVLTAWHLVVPFQQYHLKLVIGDDADQTYDSGVFLEKGSFSSGFEFDVANTPAIPKAGTDAIEGCNDIIVSFTLPQPAQTEAQIDFSVEGSATNGTDYTLLPSSVIFQPGTDSASIIIHPLPDDIPEGPETVILKILKKTCQGMIMLPDTIQILDHSPLTVSMGTDLTICPGDSVTLLAGTAGGLRPFEYSWNFPAGNDSMVTIIPGIPINNYIVQVTDRCGVRIPDSVIIRVEPVALLTNNPASVSMCSGDATGITLTSNISRAFFAWEPSLVSGTATGHEPGEGSVINQEIQLFSNSPGKVNYRIRVTGTGCDTTFANFMVTINPLPEVELGETVFLEPGSSASLIAKGDFTGWLWSNESTDSLIMVDQSGIFWVEVQNSYGCKDSDTIRVNEFGLNIPNAFSPNGDGLNDHFRIKGFEKKDQVLMQIFNRWGNLVFETRDLDKGWNGSTGNGLREAGTYVWIIHLRSDRDHIFKGTVTVVL
jgi:gliding motility-associated-like protein